MFSGPENAMSPFLLRLVLLGNTERSMDQKMHRMCVVQKRSVTLEKLVHSELINYAFSIFDGLLSQFHATKGIFAEKRC